MSQEPVAPQLSAREVCEVEAIIARVIYNLAMDGLLGGDRFDLTGAALAIKEQSIAQANYLTLLDDRAKRAEKARADA